MLNYPLKFSPILQEKIWGGTQLKDTLHKNIPSQTTGESWEVSDVAGFESVVTEGDFKGKTLKELLHIYKEDLVGKKSMQTYGERFPLLIKYIDAQVALSIQVHPHDQLAWERHQSFGKTEMWYIMHAEPDADLWLGFKEGTDAQYLSTILGKAEIVEKLNHFTPKTGDVFFVPAGAVHAIGKGVLLAEIQQTSDITYRTYDWDRLDAQGNARELHLDLAKDAVDYTPHSDYKIAYDASQINAPVLLKKCDYFTTSFWNIKGEISKNSTQKASFTIYMAVKGKAIISTPTHQVPLQMGETVLIPHSMGEYQIQAENAHLLEVTFA